MAAGIAEPFSYQLSRFTVSFTELQRNHMLTLMVTGIAEPSLSAQSVHCQEQCFSTAVPIAGTSQTCYSFIWSPYVLSLDVCLPLPTVLGCCVWYEYISIRPNPYVPFSVVFSAHMSDCPKFLTCPLTGLHFILLSPRNNGRSADWHTCKPEFTVVLTQCRGTYSCNYTLILHNTFVFGFIIWPRQFRS
jgi:hypothetical protein